MVSSFAYGLWELNATFNNISVISSWSVYNGGGNCGVPEREKNADKLYHKMLYQVHLTMRRIQTHSISVVIVIVLTSNVVDDGFKLMMVGSNQRL